MKRYTLLYLVTLLVMAALDMAWLLGIAHEFYESRIGDMLEFRLVPAVLFYLIYIAGVVVFVSGRAARWQAAALYGALFGFVAYGTYDLTNLATLKGWPESVAVVDMAWGTFNTGFSAAVGWLIARKIR